MSIQLTVDQVSGPITDGLASARGSYSAPQGLTSIVVTWRDQNGGTVVATSTLVPGVGTLDGPVVQVDGSVHEPGRWHVENVDVSALAAGPVMVLVVATDVAAAHAFDAASTSLTSGPKRFLTCEPWATHEDLDDVRGSTSYDPIPAAQVDEACWIAGDILYRLTGYRWGGLCHTDKLRPQAQWRQYDRPQWWQTANWVSTRSRQFSRYGWCSCNRGREFGCNAIPEIMLPHGPWVRDSIVVMIDGNQFDSWELRDGVWLQRTDGNGWPCCQKTWLPDTQTGTWSVSGSHGMRPDAGGVRAAAILGLNLVLAYVADDRQSPQFGDRIQTITRGGTTIQMIDPMKLFEEGLTGIPEVDLWLVSPKLGAARRPSTVHAVGKNPRFRNEG